MSSARWSKLSLSHSLSVEDGEVKSNTLYTESISGGQRRWNAKEIFLALTGSIVFVCCIMFTLWTANAAENMQIYAETFNQTLTCHIMVRPVVESVELDDHFVYSYTVLNGTVSCPIDERVVEDQEDLILLEQRRRKEMDKLSETEMTCFTNDLCDEVFFSRINSKYSESSHLFMVSASTACIGSFTFIFTLITLCFTRRDDDGSSDDSKRHGLDEYTKYEYVISALAAKIEVPEGVKELIFDFANGEISPGTWTDGKRYGEGQYGFP